MYSSVRVSTAAFWMVWKSISGKEVRWMPVEGEEVVFTCYARLIDVDEVWLEHAFWSLEALRAYFDCSTIRKLG